MNCTFNSLPREIQMQICSYLSSTELHHLFAPVCKKWQYLASLPTLRKEITIDGRAQSAKKSLSAKRQWMENIITTIRKSFKVNTVTFFRIRNWYALSRGLPACNYLRNLEFKNCKMNPKCINRLVARFPAIEGIKLIFSAGQVDFLVIRQIARWRYLKDILIHVVGDQPLFDKIGTKVVETFAIKCEYLRNFELINCKIWGRSLELLTDLRGPTLEKLWVFVRYPSFAGTDRFARCLEKCPKLKVLCLPPHCGAASFKTNTLLEELTVRAGAFYGFSYYLCDVVLEHLTKLEIANCPFSVQQLPTHCPALKWLTVVYDCMIYDDGFIYIARYCRFNADKLHCAWNLEHMKIEWCRTNTSKSLLGIVKLEITSLKCVEFLWCDRFRITDDILATARALKPNLKIVIQQPSFERLKFCN